MLWARRDIWIPLRYRENSPLRFETVNSWRKWPKIDPKNVDRNNVDQALIVIAAVPKCTDEGPILISTELPQFKVNYVSNWPEASKYTDLSELGFFKLFFSDFVVKILSKETNFYAESKLQDLSSSLYKKCHWVSTIPAEICIYLGIHLHFGLYPLAVRSDYWRIHKLS